MTQPPGIVVTGASGRMGRMLIETVNASDRARLTGAVERSGHDWTSDMTMWFPTKDGLDSQPQM